MENENKELKKKEPNLELGIVICGMMTAFSLFAALFLLLSGGTNGTAVIVMGAVFVVCVGVLLNFVMALHRRNEQRGSDEFEDIYRAQKASYLVIKRNFEDLSDLILDIEENSSLPTEDIINAQKAIAKVTISQSKENTDALMASNDTLINKVFEFEEKIETGNSEIKSHNDAAFDKLRQEISTQNSEINRRLESVNDTVRNMQLSIASIEKNQSLMGSAQPVMMAVQAMQPMQGGYAMPQQAPMQPMPQMSAPAPQPPVSEIPTVEPEPIPTPPVEELMPEPEP
ncbi:MAG: hypothetical protein IJ679_06320, partial [Lachnospiraceae bacterium]|nr:hypothetical protein [Lachnospiraceae bacterium]